MLQVLFVHGIVGEWGVLWVYLLGSCFNFLIWVSLFYYILIVIYLLVLFFFQFILFYIVVCYCF